MYHITIRALAPDSLEPLYEEILGVATNTSRSRFRSEVDSDVPDFNTLLKIIGFALDGSNRYVIVQIELNKAA